MLELAAVNCFEQANFEIIVKGLHADADDGIVKLDVDDGGESLSSFDVNNHRMSNMCSQILVFYRFQMKFPIDILLISFSSICIAEIKLQLLFALNL